MSIDYKSIVFDYFEMEAPQKYLNYKYYDETSLNHVFELRPDLLIHKNQIIELFRAIKHIHNEIALDECNYYNNYLKYTQGITELKELFKNLPGFTSSALFKSINITPIQGDEIKIKGQYTLRLIKSALENAVKNLESNPDLDFEKVYNSDKLKRLEYDHTGNLRLNSQLGELKSFIQKAGKLVNQHFIHDFPKSSDRKRHNTIALLFNAFNIIKSANPAKAKISLDDIRNWTT